MVPDTRGVFETLRRMTLWEVVGGADKGGILVREGEDLKSAQAPSRLSTGATVEELQVKGERLQYKLVDGPGPATGWVSIRVADKELVRPKATPSKAKSADTADDGIEEEEGDAGDTPTMPAQDDHTGRTEANATLGSMTFEDEDDGAENQEPELPPAPQPVEKPPETPAAKDTSPTPGVIGINSAVDIKGLKARADLNGKRATVMSHDPDSGRWEIKVEGSQERVRVKPDNLVLFVMKQSEKKTQGDAAFKEGRLDQAILLYNKAIEQDAQGDNELAATIQSNIAAAYAKKGDHQKALEAADNAVRLRPTWAKGHSRKGLSLLSLGRDSEAQASYIKAVKCDPTTEGYLAGLRQATEKLVQGQSASSKQAEAEGQKAKGNEALKAGNMPLAVAHYTMAIAIGTSLVSSTNGSQTVAVYNSNRSAAFAKLTQWDWALADAQEAKRLCPQWFKAHLRVGCALLGQGHAEHAYKTYLYASDLQNGYQEAIKECQRTLWQIPRLESPLAKRRIQRFSEDAKRPKGFCRIFAISDVHIDHGPTVVKWAEGISATEFKNDILIVAGDLGDTFNAIKRGLMLFRKKFRRVFYVPGNHDMWIRPNTEDTTKKKFKDSIVKLLAMFDMCDSIGAEMMPAEVMQDVYVVPLLSWWSCTFSQGDPTPDNHVYDSFCKWPMGEEGAHKYFIQWNDHFVRRIQRQQQERGRTGDVITFSHFLPTDDLPCGGAPLKASGCLQLEDQIQTIRAPLHIFGHTHMNIAIPVRGVRYQQFSLMGPEYGHGPRCSFLKCHDNVLINEPRVHNTY